MPEIPWRGFDAWQAWSFLSNFRGSSGFGAEPVSFSDTWRYCEMRGVDMRLRYWLCLDIAAIDNAFRAWANESSKETRIKTKSKR
jgi:hypothetical protein